MVVWGACLFLYVKAFEIREAYTCLNNLQAELCKMEDKSRNIAELEELFELAQSQFMGLKEMRQELVLLKNTWDMVDLVENLFSLWKTTLWADINTDALMEETKSLQVGGRKIGITII